MEIENNFEPTYQVSKKKSQVVNDLKQAAKDAETIYLASDPDREGEAIAWHLQELLKSKRNGPEFFRVQFNEITKNAVRAAFDHPGQVDMKLVDSQQARRDSRSHRRIQDFAAAEQAGRAWAERRAGTIRRGAAGGGPRTRNPRVQAAGVLVG